MRKGGGYSRLPSRVGVGAAAMTTSGGKTSVIQSEEIKGHREADTHYSECGI